MKIIGIRFKRGLRRPIKPTQQIYYYLCPVKSVEEGDYVCVDAKQKYNETFEIGRVEEIYEMSFSDVELMEHRITGVVLFRVPIRDFEERCIVANKRKIALNARYERAYKVKSKKK